MSEEFDNQESQQGQQSEVGSEEQQQQQKQEAVNTQSNAGIPPTAISTNKKNNFAGNNVRTNNNVPLQTVQGVTPTQAQKDAQAQATVNQNIEGDRLAHEYNEKLRLLKRIVGKASPVVEDQQDSVTQKDAEGNEVQVPVTKKVTTGYSYYSVNGKPFEEWVQEAFNGKITVDTEENKIIYNEDPSKPFEGEREDQQEAKSG